MPKMSKTFPGLTEKGRKAHVRKVAKEEPTAIANRAHATARGARLAALAASIPGVDSRKSKMHGEHAKKEGRQARVYGKMARAKAFAERRKKD